jgi:hypothetical protein
MMQRFPKPYQMTLDNNAEWLILDKPGEPKNVNDCDGVIVSFHFSPLAV